MNEHMSSSTRAVLAVAIVLAAVSLGGRQACAQHGGKPKAASCAGRLFPLAVGNKWTFVPGTPPTQPPEAMVRFIPVQAKQVVVTVTAIEAQDGKSVVKLEEDVDGRKINSTITCAAGVFEVSPDSIFFAGEPGGYFGLEFEKVDRKVVENTPWSPAWREDLLGMWKRTPEAGIEADLGKGKIEIERRFTMGHNEKVTPPYKPQGMQALRIQVEVTGRVTIDGVDKPSEMPANWVNSMWFADGIGPVQVLNSNYHMYQLSDVTLAK
jgi:hypothetical protein